MEIRVLQMCLTCQIVNTSHMKEQTEEKEEE
jgi:hypothetical protein